MAGTIVANTLNTDTGLFSTQNAYQGIAKAWVNFSGVTSVTVNKSFNISSVTRGSTGVYVIGFTTAMPDSNYVIQMSCASASASYIYIPNGQYGTSPTTTGFSIQGFAQQSGTSTVSDLLNCYIAIFSN
jgi:hypothetical protein